MGTLKPDVAVVMPAWNEAETLPSFLHELVAAFEGRALVLIVVDDGSTDATPQVLQGLQTDLPLNLLRNGRNAGHGPSTLRALRAGLATNASIIVSVDGDGRVYGADIRRLAEVASASHGVVEGVRTRRSDPIYRRVVSLATRSLVFAASGQWPRDANTPVRGYPARILEDALAVLPSDALTPNLLVSAWVRRHHLRPIEVSIVEHPPRSGLGGGTTWGKAGVKALPTRRFIQFCVHALSQWVRYSRLAR